MVGGKTWIALSLIRQVWKQFATTAFLDFEDCARGVLNRLVELGSTRDDILAGLIYIRPDEPFDAFAGRGGEIGSQLGRTRRRAPEERGAVPAKLLVRDQTGAPLRPRS